ncbi:MAG: zinc-dependent peptidase [Bacteroidota bacterium]|jgi:Mlc titration factor MtfA (ptsG expression regulator)
MTLFFVVAVVSVGLYILWQKKRSKKVAHMPTAWKELLDGKVLFYHNLPPEQKTRFEWDVMRFLSHVRIKGVHTEVDIADKLLVASSAAIPVFGFPNWDYTFLQEVLLYPSSFDTNFNINSRDEVVTGMVGSGPMEGKMILSKPALYAGFANNTDRQNVGVHEFIHLLDKEDGSIDGIPATLATNPNAIPWLKLVKEKTQEILKRKSDINAYGATHEREFFAVVGEYFFERPQLLKQNHPELYALLSQAFQQDTASLLRVTDFFKEDIGRNDPCPCGSGKKFKKCCGGADK